MTAYYTQYHWQLNKTISLVGLMGCGKSSTGKRLAKELEVNFCDLDNEIEKREKKSISDIFAQNGEKYFRKREEEVLVDIINQEPCVLATGGGAFINPVIRKKIQENTTSVWLNASFDILLERVSRKKTRPLLEQGDKAQILRSLMDERYPIYKEAHITVECTNSPHYRLLVSLLDELKAHKIIEEVE